MTEEVRVNWETSERGTAIRASLAEAHLVVSWGDGSEEAADILVTALPQILATVAENMNEEVQHG